MPTRRKILIVCNHEAYAYTVMSSLTRLGNDVLVSRTSGLFAAAEQFPADLMLADLDPATGAEDIGESIRKESWGRAVVLVGMTSSRAVVKRSLTQPTSFDLVMLKGSSDDSWRAMLAQVVAD